MIVFDQGWIPLVGLTTDEAIKAVIAKPERPLLFRGADAERVNRHIVVLADPECGPTGVAKHLRDRSVLWRNVAAITRKSDGHFGDRPKAIGVMVTACQKT